MKRIIQIIYISSIAVLLFSVIACNDDFLDKSPLDRPSDETFFSSREELTLALNAAYSGVSFFEAGFGGGFPIELSYDLMTDIGWRRGQSPVQLLGNGGADAQNDIASSVWNNYYEGISRVNNILDNMERARETVDEAFYNRVAAEARFIRAFIYHRLVGLYGDVPLVTTQLGLNEGMVARTPANEVVEFVLSELEAAAADLPWSYQGAEKGRATKGAALAILGRTALFNERWDLAIDATEQIINSGEYSLYPDYQALFTEAAEDSNNEIIFDYRYLLGVNTHGIIQFQSTRMANGWSTAIPTQAMVDSYLCTDGLPIDESPLYNPATPFENRDPRLDQSIVRPGDTFNGIIYETHPDSVTTTNVVTGERIANQDVTNPFASFSGYVWRKYLDSTFVATPQEVDLNISLIRYAEVLLTYAEAKIEAGQIDQTVIDVINQIRQRPSVNMPLIDMGSQEEMRAIIRQERKIELAYEGLRWFDIRRWGIAENVMNTSAYGRPNGAYNLQGIPSIDVDGHPNYEGYANVLKLIENRSYHPSKDKLWPIPQSEMDVNSALEQNQGY